MNKQPPKFTNKDTEFFYDHENSLYRDVRDPNWSLHFGIFEKLEWPKDYVKAANRLTDVMIGKWKIDENSSVLDVWCGTWAVDEYIQKKTWCKITWIDLSWIRIQEAQARINDTNKNKMNFIKMSADNLAFPTNSFSHVISQSALYHVHDREKAIQQIYDILMLWGTFVFEDFIRPNEEISEESMRYVYERLLYRTNFNHENYQDFLKKTWFTIIEATDISEHMKKSYNYLTEILKEKLNSGKPELMDEYKKLLEAYPFMVKAIEKWDLWQSLFVCKK